MNNEAIVMLTMLMEQRATSDEHCMKLEPIPFVVKMYIPVLGV